MAFKFTHNWHIKKLPSIFTNSFTYAKDIHSYNKDIHSDMPLKITYTKYEQELILENRL